MKEEKMNGQPTENEEEIVKEEAEVTDKKEEKKSDKKQKSKKDSLAEKA